MLSDAISDAVRQLRERGAERVALQFPAGLKRQAAEWTAALRREGFSVIVSGDPCYGACDLALDTLGQADVLIHLGHSPVDCRENVLYIPYRVDFEIRVLETVIPMVRGKTVGLVTTVQHAHLIPALRSFLEDRGVTARVAGGTGRTPLPGQVLGCSFTAARETGADMILFVGTGIFHPVGIALATKVRVLALDPVTGQVQEVNAESLLRRRFAVMEKARNATTIGIILSTKSGQHRPDLARHLAALSPAAVIVTMKEVSPDELLNLGFGCYVNTACPRLAYDDQIRFPVPVLSPQEFEILCGARSWDEYAIDEIP